MEEPESNSGTEPDRKRKRNPEYWERRNRRATESATAIKRGLTRLSKDKYMTALLEMHVGLANWVASLLATLHATRLISKSEAVPTDTADVLQPLPGIDRQLGHWPHDPSER